MRAILAPGRPDRSRRRRRWFGVISAGSLILSYLAAEVLGRRTNVGDPAVAARMLLFLNACTILGMLYFALAGSFALARRPSGSRASPVPWPSRST